MVMLKHPKPSWSRPRRVDETLEELRAMIDSSKDALGQDAFDGWDKVHKSLVERRPSTITLMASPERAESFQRTVLGRIDELKDSGLAIVTSEDMEPPAKEPDERFHASSCSLNTIRLPQPSLGRPGRISKAVKGSRKTLDEHKSVLDPDTYKAYDKFQRWYETQRPSTISLAAGFAGARQCEKSVDKHQLAVKELTDDTIESLAQGRPVGSSTVNHVVPDDALHHTLLGEPTPRRTAPPSAPTKAPAPHGKREEKRKRRRVITGTHQRRGQSGSEFPRAIVDEDGRVLVPRVIDAD